MPIDPVTAALLTSLGSAIATDGIKGSVKGIIDGYKEAKQESATLFLSLVYFFGIIAPPSNSAVLGHESFDVKDYLHIFINNKSIPDLTNYTEYIEFKKWIISRDPEFMSFVVIAAGSTALLLYPVNIVKGAIKGAFGKVAKFFDL